MHDQTSASHWSASLAFSDRRLWPKTTGEGGRGGEEGKMVGRCNDCRAVAFNCGSRLRGGGGGSQLGGALLRLALTFICRLHVGDENNNSDHLLIVAAEMHIFLRPGQRRDF